MTVKTNPSSPVQTCVLDHASGTIGSSNVEDVALTCTTSTYAVGGTVKGLSGTLVLQDNGGDDLTISASGNFTFGTKVASGGAYAVTVKSAPAEQRCTVSSASGTVTNDAITGVQVTCADKDWYFGNYQGDGPWSFVSGTFFNGDVSCEKTCAFYGLQPKGVRFVCNAGTRTTEGCSPDNDGQYGTRNCGSLVVDGVLTTKNGNTEDCNYGTSLATCWQAGNTCQEGVSYHAIECQCK